MARPFRLFSLAALFLGPLVILYITQAIWLQSLAAPIPWMILHPGAVWLFWLLFSCLSGTLYGFLRRLFWAFLPGTAALLALTFASRCKMNINGAPLQLSDFAFVGELGDVAGFASEQLLPSLTTVLAVLLGILFLALLFFLDRRWRPSAAPAFALGGVTMALLFSACWPGTLQNAALALQDGCQDQLERSDQCGAALGLYAALAQRLHMENGAASGDVVLMAEKFRTDAAEEKPLPDLGDVPDIIFVTSESFFDVTRLPGLTFEDDPLPVFHELAGEFTSGRFVSNTYGGGTGYVEMEMFTGLTASLLKEGDALSTLDEEVYETLPTTVRLLEQLGYATVSLHAHTDELYNRSTIYPAIGFQEVAFLEDFVTEPERKGDFTSDESFAEEIIARYEDRDDEQPFFLYGLSMENHQSYYPQKFWEPSGYPARSDRLSEEDLAILDSLVVGLHDADASLGILVDYFSDEDRPVMIVFVGDHLPSLNLADGTSIYTRLGVSPSEESSDWTPEVMADMLSTDYLIWTNFDTGTESNRTESCTFLGLHALERAGVPLNDYFAWLRENPAGQMLLTRNRFFVDAEGTPSYEIPEEVQPTLDLYTALERELIYGT